MTEMWEVVFRKRWVSKRKYNYPLAQPDRIGNSKDKAVKECVTKGTMGETETNFVEVGLKIVFG